MFSTKHSSRDSSQHDYESSSDERFSRLDIYNSIGFDGAPTSDDDEIREHLVRTTTQPVTQKKPKKKSDRNKQIRLETRPHGRLINGALYARMNKNTDWNVIHKLFSDVWRFPTPRMIMSIIGGSNTFTLSDRLATNFLNGIINIAIKTNLWIITSGYNNGLVELVGQAFLKAKLKKSENQAVALAICKYGAIKNPQKLIKPKKKDSSKNKDKDIYHIQTDQDEIEGQEVVTHELDMNHSHYLMLDDRKDGSLNTKDYRTRLCNRMAMLVKKKEFPIPLVTLVVNGGDATISNIYYDLKTNIPVLIISGTGGVANFFSRWLLYTKEFDNDIEKRKIVYGIDELKSNSVDHDKNTNRVRPVGAHHISRSANGRIDVNLNIHHVYIDLESKKLADIFSKYKTHMVNDLKKLLYYNNNGSDTINNTTVYNEQNSSNDKIERACEQVMFCLQPSIRSNITVFNLNSDIDLSETIFRSISKSYEKFLKEDKSDEKSNSTKNKDLQKELAHLLDLAMDWDCIEVAKDLIFQNSLENLLDEDIPIKFKYALKENLFTFVYEFIRLGVNPADIFFPKDTFSEGRMRYNPFLKELYGQTILKKNSELQAFIKENRHLRNVEIISTDALNVLLRVLIGDYMHKIYFDSLVTEDEYRKENGLAKRLLQTGLIKTEDYERIKSLTDEERKHMAYDYIMRDLFLWSILMNYVDMAKVLLSHMKYRICPALIATKIFKQYHRKAPYGDLKEGYMESAKYFEQYAIDCLDKCDDHNVELACEIILQQNELYGYVTCLQVASDAEDKLFIAQPCCIQAMNSVWYDKLHPEQSRKRDILRLTMSFLTLGFGASAIVKYRKFEQEEKGETLVPVLKSCGINYSDPYRIEHPRYWKSSLTMNRYLHRLKNFHLSLMMKFCYQLILYIFFLLLFSYVLLFDFEPPTNQIPSIHWTEILTIILVSCMLIEEIHYFFAQDNLSLRGRFENYFVKLFKLMTFVGFLLFYIGLIVRFTYASSEIDFTAARVIMAIDLEIWWLRSLSFIIVIPYLGPHLVAIAKMLKDLMFFILIIAIVMIGYGVASRSMVYYPKANGFTTETGGSIDTSFDGRSVFYQIAYPVYYFLHGEFAGELENLGTNRNAGWSIATHVLLAFHMLFVNILLTNLLIAMFSKRFEQVYEDTNNIWHSQRYLFIREYYTRAPFVPPISLVYDVYHLCRMFVFFIRRKVYRSADYHARVFKIIAKDKSLIRKWYEFEGASTYEYAHDEVKAATEASIGSSNRQVISHTDHKEDTVKKEKDTVNVTDNLKQVQRNISKLNAAVQRMAREMKT